MCPNPSQIATDGGHRHTERATNLRQAQSSQSKTRNLPPPFFQFALSGQNLREIFTVFTWTASGSNFWHRGTIVGHFAHSRVRETANRHRPLSHASPQGK